MWPIYNPKALLNGLFRIIFDNRLTVFARRFALKYILQVHLYFSVKTTEK